MLIVINIGCQYSRPVMVRVRYSCDEYSNIFSTVEFETTQVKDRWGEWKTDFGYIQNLCREEEREVEPLIKRYNKMFK